MALLIKIEFEEQTDRRPRRAETRIGEVRTRTEAVLKAAEKADKQFGSHYEVYGRNNRLVATIDVRENGSVHYKGSKVGS